MLSHFPATSFNPQPMHSVHISSKILITLIITLRQHSVFFLGPFMPTCWQLNYPDSEVLPQTSVLEGSDTIVLSVGSSGIASLISIFVSFIFIKDCWILFKPTNSAFSFYQDTITRRVTLLGSERPIYPHQKMVIPHQIPILVIVLYK